MKQHTGVLSNIEPTAGTPLCCCESSPKPRPVQGPEYTTHSLNTHMSHNCQYPATGLMYVYIGCAVGQSLYQQTSSNGVFLSTKGPTEPTSTHVTNTNSTSTHTLKGPCCSAAQLAVQQHKGPPGHQKTSETMHTRYFCKSYRTVEHSNMWETRPCKGTLAGFIELDRPTMVLGSLTCTCTSGRQQQSIP